MDSDVEKSLNSSHQKGDLGTLCKKKVVKGYCCVQFLVPRHRASLRSREWCPPCDDRRAWVVWKILTQIRRNIKTGRRTWLWCIRWLKLCGFKLLMWTCQIWSLVWPWNAIKYMVLQREDHYFRRDLLIIYNIYIINNFRGYFLWSAWLPWWRFTLFDVCRFFKWVLNLVSCWCTMEILTTSGKMFYESSLCLSRWWTFELFGMTSIRLSDDHPSTAHRT